MKYRGGIVFASDLLVLNTDGAHREAKKIIYKDGVAVGTSGAFPGHTFTYDDYLNMLSQRMTSDVNKLVSDYLIFANMVAKVAWDVEMREKCGYEFPGNESVIATCAKGEQRIVFHRGTEKDTTDCGDFAFLCGQVYKGKMKKIPDLEAASRHLQKTIQRLSDAGKCSGIEMVKITPESAELIAYCPISP